MLDCFHYSRHENVDPRIWSIFKGIEKYGEVDGFRIEHVDEMLTAALNGDINLKKEFNLAGYERAILAREHKNSRVKASKIKFISFADSATETESDLRNGGMTIDEVSYMSSNFSDVKSDFDKFFDNEELQSAVSNIRQLNEDFIVDYNLDLVVLLKKATSGIPQAISKLKEVCEEFKVVGEQIRVILASGVSVDECFG